MLDISQATHMLTSLGVSSTLAARAAERTAQQHGDADPLTFLKELQSTLAELSAPPATAAGATGAAPQSGGPYQATADRYTGKAEAPAGPAAAGSASATSSTAGTTEAAAAPAKAPFSNLAEFRQWERGLGHTFAEDYEVPDYVRLHSMMLSGGDDTVVGRYMFFKNHPEFAEDYAAIRSGQLSKCPTDGSTLIKSDLSQMPAETAAFYKSNPAALRAAEGFSMDPTLAKQRWDGELDVPQGVSATEWLTTHKWTADGVVEQDNRLFFAQAPYIGLDGQGAGTYRRTTYDAATNSILDHDGTPFDPLTGEARA